MKGGQGLMRLTWNMSMPVLGRALPHIASFRFGVLKQMMSMRSIPRVIIKPGPKNVYPKPM